MKFLKKVFNKNSLEKRGLQLISASLFANFLNLVYNAYLGRTISVADFATISLLGSMFNLVDLPIYALGRTVTHKSAYFLGRYRKPARDFWSYARTKSTAWALFGTILWVMACPFMYKFFRLESALPLLAISPIWIMGVLTSVDGGFIKGNLQFGKLALMGLTDSSVRLASVVVLSLLGLEQLAYLGIPISSFATFMLASYYAKKIAKPAKVVKKEHFPKSFFATSALTKLSVTVYMTLDIILAKHFLSPEQAGHYALLSLTGKMVFFTGSLVSQFILPMVSHGEGEKNSSVNVFVKLMAGTFASSTLAFLVLFVAGQFMLPLIFGDKIQPILPLVGVYAGGMVAFTLATNIIAYHQIKGRHLLPIAGMVIALIQVLIILFFNNSFTEIALGVATVGFASLFITFILHFLYGRFVTLKSNTLDFLDLFKPLSLKGNGMKILIYNWRDTKHVWAGGAEVYIHQLAKEWSKMGHQVTVFCGNDNKSKRKEKVSGIQIVRRGGFYTVYFWAVLYYIFKFRGKFDVIVDSENGIPFFTPLFSRKEVVLLIHHVHQEIFMQHLKFPLSHIARFLEGKAMPFIYKKSQVVTVSASSKSEIVRAKLAQEEQIQIINPGLSYASASIKKTQYPSVLYLGRLKPYKNIDVAIKAFASVSKKHTEAKFVIAGSGESLSGLKQLVEKLSLKEKVLFLGKISERKKAALLSESWIAVQPSSVEGWGITVLEANAYKTPVIASNTNGLKDAIVDGKTGLLVPLKNISAMEIAMEKLISNTNLRVELSKNAYKWSKEFSWEKNAQNFYQLIEQQLQRRPKYISGATKPVLNN